MHKLEQSILARWAPQRWRRTRVLIGVSGGADSVALLLALRQVAEDSTLLHAAHYNHQWRGEESDADAAFVRKLCESMDCPLSYGSASQPAEKDSLKSEESARKERYEFMAKAAYQAGCRYIATAHTASDRIETVLHNLFRGTGLSGVASPQISRPMDEELVLVRPLLGCSRSDVLDYLNHRGQDYREDSSNLDLQFRRNYIRRELLPAIREQYGTSVDQKLLSFSELAEEANEVFKQYALDYLEEAEAMRQSLGVETLNRAPVREDRILLPSFALLRKPWPIVRQALAILMLEHSWPQQALNRSHWNTIRNMLEDRNGKHSVAELPGQIRVSTSDKWIQLVRKTA